MSARSHAVRVLYIDIEGGWGGSSRSLLYLVGALDRSKVAPIVWHRKEGPVSNRLESLAIEHRHEPRILSIIPWHSKNWKIWLANSFRFIRLWSLAGDIKGAAPDVLHLNYEGLTPLLLFVRMRGLKSKIVLHVRTQAPANWIYRLYARIINKHADYLVFITENERARAVEAGVDLDRIGSVVLYNPVSAELLGSGRPRQIGLPLRIIYLGTLSVAKGASRLLELARLLRDRRVPAVIEAYGRSQQSRSFVIFREESISRMQVEIEQADLSGHLELRGHTSEPEARLAEADILVRPSIFNDPWGRDVLEAMAVGTPVVGVGEYRNFIRSGETGLLMKEWSADVCADFISSMCEQPDKMIDLVSRSRSLARELFDPDRYARSIEGIYEHLTSEKCGSLAARS